MPDRDAKSSGWEADWSARTMGWSTSVMGSLGLVVAGVVLVWAGSDRSDDGSARPVATCRALLNGLDSPVFSLAWSPDGHKLAISGFGPTVKLWDRESGLVGTIEGGTERPRFIIGWSDDGHRLVVGGIEEPVEAWDLVANEAGGGREITRPDGPSDALRMIAEGSRGGAIRVRGPIDWRTAWLPASDHAAISAAFARDGLSIVTAEVDQSIRIWDARSGQLRHTLQGDWRGISCVAFSPDGSKIASGGGGAA